MSICVQMLVLCVFLLDMFVHWCSECYNMWWYHISEHRWKRSCAINVCVGVKKFVTLKVHLFQEDQRVYKCRHTLVSPGLRVDYTADRFNSLALTDITADTLIALRRERLFICRNTIALVSEGYLRCRHTGGVWVMMFSNCRHNFALG